ncbi:MAG: CoA transferase, partial [Pseudomonas sp.]
ASPVWNLEQAASSEQAQVRQLLIHSKDSTVPLVPQPVFFNGHKPHASSFAPQLGADNQAFGLNIQELCHEL